MLQHLSHEKCKMCVYHMFISTFKIKSGLTKHNAWILTNVFDSINFKAKINLSFKVYEFHDNIDVGLWSVMSYICLKTKLHYFSTSICLSINRVAYFTLLEMNLHLLGYQLLAVLWGFKPIGSRRKIDMCSFFVQHCHYSFYYYLDGAYLDISDTHTIILHYY